MKDELLGTLGQIASASDALLTDTELNDLQRKFLLAIYQSSNNLRDWVITIPDLTWERAAEILSYEGREQLSSIIGYAEVLLEEAEGDLDHRQRGSVHEIRSMGKRLLTRLSQWFET